MNSNLMVSSSPHIRSKETVSSVMRDVIIALVPAGIMGIVFFGVSLPLLLQYLLLQLWYGKHFITKLQKNLIQ